MIYIIAAATTDPALEELLNQYDNAQDDEAREQIAADAHKLVGGKIKSMIQSAAGQRKLNPDQLEAISWQVLMQSLGDAGIPKIKRGDGVWENFIEMVRRGHPVGKRIWHLLAPPVRQELERNPHYLKAPAADALVRNLNMLLRRRDFYDPSDWQGVAVPDEARALLAQGIGNLPTSELV